MQVFIEAIVASAPPADRDRVRAELEADADAVNRADADALAEADLSGPVKFRRRWPKGDE